MTIIVIEIRSQPSTPKKLSVNMNDDESFSAEREGNLMFA